MGKSRRCCEGPGFRIENIKNIEMSKKAQRIASNKNGGVPPAWQSDLPLLVMRGGTHCARRIWWYLVAIPILEHPLVRMRMRIRR